MSIFAFLNHFFGYIGAGDFPVKNRCFSPIILYNSIYVFMVVWNFFPPV